jgi:hypothetical protein
MLGDNAPVLADYDAIRIGVNFDGTTDSATKIVSTAVFMLS